MLRQGTLVYADSSVIGGCEDAEFRAESLALWQQFVDGVHTLVLSEHTLRELAGAPAAVRARLAQLPETDVVMLPDSDEAYELAEASCSAASLAEVPTPMRCTSPSRLSAAPTSL